MQGTLRRFTCDDLLRFNNINMDVLTETVRPGASRGRLRMRQTGPLDRC